MVNPAHAKALRGHETDAKDSARLAELFECGRGREAEARAVAAEAAEAAERHGLGAGVSFSRAKLAQLELSLGNYREALGLAQYVFAEDPLCLARSFSLTWWKPRSGAASGAWPSRHWTGWRPGHTPAARHGASASSLALEP